MVPKKKCNFHNHTFQSQLITTDGLPLYGSEVHQRVRLGHNNAVESRYSLLKDFIRAKRDFKKFSNIPKYINGWVYIHNLFKDLGSDKYAIIQSLLALSR
ncbi:MAG: DDE-type integrase/transposase/recombinase [Fervidobacterium sp.]